jgi:HNH endonuclease
VQVPAKYGDFAYAGPGSPLLALTKYGRDACILLQLHLQIVLYSKKWRLEGIVSEAVICYLAYPARPRTAKRDLGRLVEAGFIEPRDGNYYVPAAAEWPVVRVGTRDPISDYIRAKVYEHDGWCCVECGSAKNLTLDHITPWSLYGSDDEENLRTLCGSCNSSKGARV